MQLVWTVTPRATLVRPTSLISPMCFQALALARHRRYRRISRVRFSIRSCAFSNKFDRVLLDPNLPTNFCGRCVIYHDTFSDAYIYSRKIVFHGEKHILLSKIELSTSPPKCFMLTEAKNWLQFSKNVPVESPMSQVLGLGRTIVKISILAVSIIFSIQ